MSKARRGDVFIEDYKITKRILNYLGIYEFGKKMAPPKINTSPDEFDDYVCDDYIDCDHVYQDGCRVTGCLAAIKLAWI